MYDVVVVGAGPSGASSAYFLSLAGYKVLLLERDPRVAHRVICGEYLPDKRSLGLPDWIGEPYMKAFRERVVHDLKRVSMVVAGRKFSAEYEGYSVDRRGMIRDLVVKAEEHGASVLTSAPVTGVKNVGGSLKVVTVKGTHEARYVVGADGYGSAVAKSFGIRFNGSKDDLAIAFPLEMSLPLENPEEMTLYISEEFSPGTYAWVIPRGDGRANVGVGVRLTYWKGDATPYLRKFLSFLGVGAKTRVFGRYVPVSGRVVPVASKGVFLVGDSANMVIPVNGGGMHNGILASILLSRSLESDEPELSYTELVKEYIEPQVRLGLTYRRAADFLMKSGLLNKVIGVIPEKVVEDVIAVRRGPYYPMLWLASLLYPLVRT